jgi:tRNA A-37 threonylcarbamoyl transferase component Bud32
MSSFIELTTGNMRWRIAPEHRELLLSDDGLRLEEWLQNGQARIVKHAAHRTVYQVRLPGLHFFLKQNRIPDARARVREWLRPGKALAEYERALAVAERQVPTYVPLAAGVPCRSGTGESFLLTHALEETRQLNTFLEQELSDWPEPRRTRLRQRIALALGDLLARMHDAGIVHQDLHAGNLLLHLDQDDRPRLYLIDLQAVRLGPPLNWRASRNNLVLVNRWFILRASRTERLRTWHAYCASRSARAGQGAVSRCVCPHRLREVEEHTLASNRAFWRGLDRRCLETNRRFHRITSPGVIGHAVTDLRSDVLEEMLRDPDMPFRQEGVKLLKDSRSSTVAELELPLSGVMQRVIYKRFRVTSWLDPWLALVRPTGAMRSWVLGHGMRLRWLPTPRPLLLLHRKRGRLLHEGYLLTAKVQDADDLHAFMKRMMSLTSAERKEQMRPVLEQVARLIRGLHQRRLSHRDLKATNLLVSRRTDGPVQSSSAEPLDHWPLTNSRVWFIDLVGVRRHWRLGRRRRVQNLARLNTSFLGHPAVTNADLLRFLLIYLESGLRGRGDWKSWWRGIARATRAKITRNQRTGRPLS